MTVPVRSHTERPPEYDDNTVEKDVAFVNARGGVVDAEEAGSLDVPDVDDPDHEGPPDVEDADGS
jgi:hypothetical protein